MGSNERVQRGDAELVVTDQRVVEPAAPAPAPIASGRARVVLPPPPDRQLRAPSSWLRRR